FTSEEPILIRAIFPPSLCDEDQKHFEAFGYEIHGKIIEA
ncbi:unnamed protein product, partial [Rotaria sordida]